MIYYPIILFYISNMKKLLIVSALFLSLILPKTSLAQYQTDEEVNQIVVDKTIKGLDRAVWQDNYSSNEIIFKPGDQFEFQIVVRNTGNRNLTWIQVRDRLPASLAYIFGRNGATYENGSITWSIPEIRPGESQSTVIRVRVNKEISISLKEWVNFVEARAESGAYDSDTSAFWTTEGQLTVTSGTTKTLPDTGANNNQFVIGSLVSTSMIAMAIFFRRYVRGC